MATEAGAKRPSFADAKKAWKDLLAERGLPTECLWIFDENLCFEKDTGSPGGFRLGYQVALTPPPPGADRISYEHFSDIKAPLVFYRIGSSRGKSICLMLCDDWFKGRNEGAGFVQRDEWLMAFYPGNSVEVLEVTELEQWKNRMLRDRPLHELDFCMSLRAVHEMLAHGYILTDYDRYALKFLHAWRRLLGQP